MQPGDVKAEPLFEQLVLQMDSYLSPRYRSPSRHQAQKFTETISGARKASGYCTGHSSARILYTCVDIELLV